MSNSNYIEFCQLMEHNDPIVQNNINTLFAQ